MANRNNTREFALWDARKILNVSEAALFACGMSPATDYKMPYFEEDTTKFSVVKTELQRAVLSKELKATVSYEPVEPSERLPQDRVVEVHNPNTEETEFMYIREPNWELTYIEKPDLEIWLQERDINFKYENDALVEAYGRYADLLVPDAEYISENVYVLLETLRRMVDHIEDYVGERPRDVAESLVTEAFGDRVAPSMAKKISEVINWEPHGARIRPPGNNSN